MIAGSGRRLRARSGAGAAAASRKKRNGKHGAFQAAIGVIHAGEPSGCPFFLSKNAICEIIKILTFYTPFLRLIFIFLQNAEKSVSII